MPPTATTTIISTPKSRAFNLNASNSTHKSNPVKTNVKVLIPRLRISRIRSNTLTTRPLEPQLLEPQPKVLTARLRACSNKRSKLISKLRAARMRKQMWTRKSGICKIRKILMEVRLQHLWEKAKVCHDPGLGQRREMEKNVISKRM